MKGVSSDQGIKLEDFQRRTSEFVFEALTKRSSPIYSIADEVGLGKTWIVADVLSKRLNGRARIGKKTFVFYVAPSSGLLKQNIKRIYRYIKSRSEAEKPGRKVFWYQSRLSTLLLDSEEMLEATGDAPGGCVHLVGLTSEVSFKLSGTGTLDERALLCAVFLGSARSTDYEQEFAGLTFSPARWFFLLENRSEQRFEGWYSEVREHLRVRRELVEKIREKIDFAAFELEFSGRSKNASPRNSFVRMFRKHATLASMKVASVTDLVLDEWHRYSSLCTDPAWGVRRKGRVVAGSTVLPDLLRDIREGARDGAAAVLVSATPFVVRFEDSAGQEDLQNLARIEFGKERGEALFHEISKLQSDFIKQTLRAADMETKEKSDWSEVKTAGRLLQDKLLSLTVRTERPAATGPSTVAEDHSGYVKYWKQADLLIHVANAEVRSPVPALWSDSRQFVETADYKSVQKHWSSLSTRKGRKLLKETHWKILELQKSIDEMLDAQPAPKQTTKKLKNYPPLWLPICDESRKANFSKFLIFSEFTVTPHEVSDTLRLGPLFGEGGKSTDSFSGSIYGWFPDYLGDGRRSPETAAHSWIHFFPLVVVEMWGADHLLTIQEKYKALLRKALSKRRDDADLESRPELIKLLLAVDYYLLRTLPEVDAAKFEEAEARIAQRAYMFDVDFDDIKSASDDELQEYVHHFSRLDLGELLHAQTPAVIFATAFGELRERFTHRIVPETQEQAVLKGAESILRLFTSPEAQLICKEVYRLHKHRIQFVRRYCHDNALSHVLDEYFELLAMEFCDSSDPLRDIMNELHDVVTMGRGKTHKSKYIRPYSDSKSEHAGQEKKIATTDLISAFNSPFPPYVLVTTSIGQEGIDFHRYCRRIIHWSAPHCPSVLQQREGRLDRYRSLQVREAIRFAQAHGIEVQETGFSPHFTVLDKQGRRLNSLERRVLFLPFSQQEKRWERCLERSYLTGILVGTPDPISVEARFRGVKERCSTEVWQRILERVRDCSISLRPKEKRREA